MEGMPKLWTEEDAERAQRDIDERQARNVEWLMAIERQMLEAAEPEDIYPGEVTEGEALGMARGLCPGAGD